MLLEPQFRNPHLGAVSRILLKGDEIPPAATYAARTAVPLGLAAAAGAAGKELEVSEWANERLKDFSSRERDRQP